MRIVATLGLVALCGCGKDQNAGQQSTASSDPSAAFEPARTTPSLDVDSACFNPLDAYCGAARPCPTYTASADDVQEMGSSGHCLRAVIGTCNDLRFTLINGGFTSSTRYFDAAGRLVAARETTDVIGQNATCPNWTHYGPRIACEDVVTKDYCSRWRG